MKRVMLILSFMLISLCIFSQTVIEMTKDGGVYTVPCTINGYKVSMIFDTGASNVSLSSKVASYMFRNGLLRETDIIGEGSSTIASGESIDHIVVKIKRLEIGGIKIDDVKAVILDSQTAPLLLGLSAIQKIGKVGIDGNKLIINKSTANYSPEYIDKIYDGLESEFSSGSYNMIIHQMEDFKYKNLLTDKGYRYLARCYLSTHKDRECIDVCNEWIGDPYIFLSDDSYFYSYYYRMIAYEGLKDRDNTILYSEKMIDCIEHKRQNLSLSSNLLDELLGDAYYMQGFAYYDKNAYTLANSCFEKSLSVLQARYGLSKVDILDGKGRVNDTIGSCFLMMATISQKQGDYNGYVCSLVFGAMADNKVAIKYCRLNDIDYITKSIILKNQIQSLGIY